MLTATSSQPPAHGHQLTATSSWPPARMTTRSHGHPLAQPPARMATRCHPLAQPPAATRCHPLAWPPARMATRSHTERALMCTDAHVRCAYLHMCTDAHVRCAYTHMCRSAQGGAKSVRSPNSEPHASPRVFFPVFWLYKMFNIYYFMAWHMQEW